MFNEKLITDLQTYQVKYFISKHLFRFRDAINFSFQYFTLFSFFAPVFSLLLEK